MSANKPINNLQYAYSQSFRNIYRQSPNIMHLSPHYECQNIKLQYQTVPTIQLQSIHTKQSSKLHQASNNIIKSPSSSSLKRFGINNKKYSFSVFVKHSQKMRKKTIQNANSSQLVVKVKRQRKNLTKTIKTMYEAFRKDNGSFVQTRKSQQNNSTQMRAISLDRAKQNNSILIREIEKQKRQHRILNKTQRLNRQSPQILQQKIFSRTISFGDKINRSKDLSRITSIEPPHSSYFSVNSKIANLQQILPPQNFLSIQKCQIQKKQVNFIKNCLDFRQSYFKQRLQQENKRKMVQIICQSKKINEQEKKIRKEAERYLGGRNDGKYVAAVRENKKIKKVQKVEEEGEKNKIQPW